MSLLPKVDVPAAIQRGSGFFSFIIGLGLAALFFHRPYIVEPILAVEPSELTGKVVQRDSKCYRYRVEDAACQFSPSL